MTDLFQLAALTFPEIDPVIFQIGPFALRWYALSYVFGLILGWRYCRSLGQNRSPARIPAEFFDDLLLWATLGVVLGGRFGYVLFYNPAYFLSNPLQIFKVWEGGMSFHGGLIGVVLAIILFSRFRKLDMFAVGDVVAAAAPIGLFFGRVANFINGELFGRVTTSPLGMVFPHGGPLPRHPSQLYEALLEGVVLFLVLFFLARKGGLRHRGLFIGVFLGGYGLARFIVEYFREPDSHLGLLFDFISMGQILSLPMILLGAGFIVWAMRTSKARATTGAASDDDSRERAGSPSR